MTCPACVGVFLFLRVCSPSFATMSNDKPGPGVDASGRQGRDPRLSSTMDPRLEPDPGLSVDRASESHVISPRDKHTVRLQEKPLSASSGPALSTVPTPRKGAMYTYLVVIGEQQYVCSTSDNDLVSFHQFKDHIKGRFHLAYDFDILLWESMFKQYVSFVEYSQLVSYLSREAHTAGRDGGDPGLVTARLKISPKLKKEGDRTVRAIKGVSIYPTVNVGAVVNKMEALATYTQTKSRSLISNLKEEEKEVIWQYQMLKMRMALRHFESVQAKLRGIDEDDYRRLGAQLHGVIYSIRNIVYDIEGWKEKEDSIVAAQRIVRKRLKVPALYKVVKEYITHPAAKCARTRLHVLAEIIKTEQYYHDSLRTLCEEFMPPLKAVPGVPKEELSSVFSEAYAIMVCSQQLLADLAREREAVAAPAIGKIFLNLAPFFKLYTAYVNNHPYALQCLQALKKVKTFAAELRKIEERFNSPIESYLIMPVQRLPRYVLLLQDLLRHTIPEHRDHEHLSKAVAIVKDITSHVNKSKREFENMEKVSLVQNAITHLKYNLVARYRSWVKEGQLCVEYATGELRQVFCFLMTDMLLITTPASGDSGQYVFQDFVLLKHLTVDTKLHKPRPESPSMPGFSLIPLPTDMPPLNLYFEDAATHDAWLAALREAVQHDSQAIVPLDVEDIFQTPKRTGWLYVRDRFTWEYKFARLKGNTVFLYSSQQTNVPSKEVDLRGYDIRKTVNPITTAEFLLLQHPIKDWEAFAADDESVLDEWHMLLDLWAKKSYR
mmetsp:Transcript_43455/g.109693  ORF Transcript_43455/g.109693 Transcript_43455/m.109693 type:complete len:775 (-) Transcript_43455:9-2333(-)